MSIPSQVKAGIFAGESGGDYNALFGYSNRRGPFAGVNVTDMTVNEVLRFTDPSGPYGQWVKGQVGRVATPVGAYQVVGSTLRDAVRGLGLTGDEKFDQATQDAIGAWIYQTQGTGAWEGYKGPRAGGDEMRPGLLSMSSSGMPEEQPQQPMGFMDRLRQPETRDGILAWINSMRLSPDPNINKMIDRRAERRDQDARLNRTAEVLAQISPEAAALVREGLLSPGEALGVYRDQRAQQLAAQATDALARGDYQTAYALSLQISPTAAGQAIAQQFGPRAPEVTGGGMYTVTYENGVPKIAVNEGVQQAELERIRAEAEIREANKPPTAPPAAIVKSEEEDFAAIDTLDQLNSDLGGIIQLFGLDPTTGEFRGPLKIGPLGAVSGALGYMGVGQRNEETRLARAAYDRFITRYVNDSLRLNSGVQTEGDAVRAAEELGNATSTEAAYAALVELARINQRARQIKERAIGSRRERYGLDGVAVAPAQPVPGLDGLSPDAQRYLEGN